MSKMLNRALMVAYADMTGVELSEEDEKIYLSIGIRENNMSRRVNELGAHKESLSGPQLDEFNELIATEREFDEIVAERLPTEELESYVKRLSEREEDLPYSAKITLQVYRETLESRKTK